MSGNFGKVRIGQKFRRGVRGDKSASKVGYINIDVTSGSHNKVGGIWAGTLSPFYLGPVTDNEGNVARKFENYWQYGKMWKKAGHIDSKGNPTDKWFKFREKGYKSKKGKRRPLPVKEYGFPCSSFYNGKIYGYLKSRKRIYVPIYRKLIKNLPIIRKLKSLLKSGKSIMIIDNDGPPKNLYPEGIAMNKNNWNIMINDPNYQFGHGYIVAGLLAGTV